jgi:hypothetical protein
MLAGHGDLQIGDISQNSGKISLFFACLIVKRTEKFSVMAKRAFSVPDGLRFLPILPPAAFSFQYLSGQITPYPFKHLDRRGRKRALEIVIPDLDQKGDVPDRVGNHFVVQLRL